MIKRDVFAWEARDSDNYIKKKEGVGYTYQSEVGVQYIGTVLVWSKAGLPDYKSF